MTTMYAELWVWISDYCSYDADKKTLEKVSNLVKRSLLFYRAFKYELIILNKQIHFSTFPSVYYSQFNNLKSKFKIQQT